MSPRDENPTPPGDDTLGWESGAMSTATRDLTGKTLGDFQVERMLGSGGMGEVYLARQASLNRLVALKVLRPDLLTKAVYLSRFEAEATAVAKLNHPNIVHIYTLGATDGVRFIAMEYVQGTNLRDYLQKKGALELPLALSIMRQAGVAIGAAGELGLIHRDIKPENLLLTRKGQVKVADFGLCRDMDAERGLLTQPGVTMGTPAYMSPEQAQGHPLDHRSDLYSLGVTFYHMITGEPPFTADTPLALALKQVRETPVPPTSIRPDIPVELERLVLKLMAKSPAARYQSAAEMLRDLAKVREAISAPSGAQPLTDLPSLTHPLTPLPTVVGRPPATAAAPSSGMLERVRLLDSDPARPIIGGGLGAALVVLGLALGAGLGWYNRPENLLAPGRGGASADDEGRAMPGLWIAPRWSEIEKAPSAGDQYRWAQLRAPRDVSEAAWLAVPGNFPASREWASHAYTQLARLLLARRDADRLRAFAAEIDRWTGAQKHEKELADVIRAGADALEGDLDGVLDDFATKIDPEKLTDPALLELSLEVTNQAQRFVAQGGADKILARQNLDKVRQKLMSKLFLAELRDPLFNPFKPGGRPGTRANLKASRT